jgi:hypothetical protein
LGVLILRQPLRRITFCFLSQYSLTSLGADTGQTDVICIIRLPPDGVIDGKTRAGAQPFSVAASAPVASREGTAVSGPGFFDPFQELVCGKI